MTRQRSAASCSHRRPRWKQLAARMRRDDGSVAVEYVIVAPIVLMVLFLAIQIAMYSYARSIALTAAQQGVNAARAYNANPGAGQDKAASFIARAGGDMLTGTGISVDGGAEQVSVTVTGRSLSLVPGVSGFDVSQTATAPLERFIE